MLLGGREAQGPESIDVGKEDTVGCKVVAGHHEAAQYWEYDGKVRGLPKMEGDVKAFEVRQSGEGTERVELDGCAMLSALEIAQVGM